jgi:hypothetical protein
LIPPATIQGTTLKANYIKKALGKFIKIFRKRRLLMAEGKCFFHWYNAPVLTVPVVQD